MNKIIINVGRQIGSGGHIIAEKLAEDFGCKCYDRELLNLAAKAVSYTHLDVYKRQTVLTKPHSQNSEGAKIREIRVRKFNFLLQFPTSFCLS